MRSSIRTTILSLIFVAVYTVTFSQTIKGEVKDKNTGEPLIGANVVLATDSGVGTVTDFDGSFDLKVSSFPVTLNVSYIGYTATDYEVTSANQKINILISYDKT